MFNEFGSWLQASPLSLTIQTVTWIIPLTQSVHIVTIAVVFVAMLILALRILGTGIVDEPFDALLRRFAPWIGYGLIVMATTGAILVVGEPLRQFNTLSFWLKMSLLAVGIVSGTFFLSRLRAFHPAPDAAAEFPRGLKTAALATLAIWVCIIYLGRAIAYDVEVWESYSLASGSMPTPTE